jgi:hypothetical protein
MSRITHDCPSSRASQRVHPFAVRAHRFRHHERARNAAPLASPSLDPRARRRPRRQAVRGNTRRPSGARVARARHRGARVSGPEERPAQPDAWVERRRSLSAQQKHLSGADQASRRQFNWRAPRAAQARWLSSGASGQPRESGAPPGAGRPCKKKKRARNSHFSGPLWTQNAIFGALELQEQGSLTHCSHLDPVLTLKCP